MSGRPTAPPALPEPSVIPTQGWHCSHFCYRFDRMRLKTLSHAERAQGREAFVAALEIEGDQRPQRLQAYLTSGHRADWLLMMMDPDPLKIDAIHQHLLSGPLGAALETTWSFVSMSEISEYVPSVEQYRERLIREGEAADSPALVAKVNAYEKRLPMMNRQRLSPDFPEWPAACFYPMNKRRVEGANWFSEPFSRRSELMAEHARSGIAFAGRVSQVITVGVGVDDWEWMVTLWARNPEYLSEIVYKMRFDEASAKYAEFGPFYVGYRTSAAQILKHCRI